MLHPQKCSKKLFSGIDVYVVKMLYETSNGNVKVKNLVIETQRYRNIILILNFISLGLLRNFSWGHILYILFQYYSISK